MVAAGAARWGIDGRRAPHAAALRGAGRADRHGPGARSTRRPAGDAPATAGAAGAKRAPDWTTVGKAIDTPMDNLTAGKVTAGAALTGQKSTLQGLR
jgi:hypothetical protein